MWDTYCVRCILSSLSIDSSSWNEKHREYSNLKKRWMQNCEWWYVRLRFSCLATQWSGSLPLVASLFMCWCLHSFCCAGVVPAVTSQQVTIHCHLCIVHCLLLLLQARQTGVMFLGNRTHMQKAKSQVDTRPFSWVAFLVWSVHNSLQYMIKTSITALLE